MTGTNFKKNRSSYEGKISCFGIMITDVNRKEENMTKLNPILSSVSVLLIVSMSCVLPGVSTPNPGSNGTAVAQTIIAGLTQAAPSMTPIFIQESPTFTFTPEPPTPTPTQTLTATLAFTFTPAVPLISVSVPTNCRKGPGKAYDREGALLVGEVAEVYGHDPTGNYWYIRNPDPGDEFCWVWGEYATVTGNTIALPVYTPPPTPTPSPDFEASYAGLDTCVGWWAEFNLRNIGGTSFKSMSLTVRDTVTDVVLTQNTDGFTNIDGCLTSNTNDTLPVGATRTVSAPPFAYNPTGHELRATITLCSGSGQTGMCTSDVIRFTP